MERDIKRGSDREERVLHLVRDIIGEFFEFRRFWSDTSKERLEGASEHDDFIFPMSLDPRLMSDSLLPEGESLSRTVERLHGPHDIPWEKISNDEDREESEDRDPERFLDDHISRHDDAREILCHTERHTIFLLFGDEVEMISKSIETIIGEEESTLLREEISRSENPLPIGDSPARGDDLEVGEFCLRFIWSVHPLHDFFDVVFLLILPLSIRSLEYESILDGDDKCDDECEEKSDLRTGSEVHNIFL